MTLVPLKCPNCAGDIQLDDGREFGFCIYCGTRILISEFVTQKVEVDYSRRASSFAEIALDWLRRGEVGHADEYADKALDTDPSNPDAWFVKGMISPNSVEQTMAFERAVSSKNQEVVDKSKARLDELYDRCNVMVVNELGLSAMPGWLMLDGEPFMFTRDNGKMVGLARGHHEFVLKLDGFKKETARLEHEFVEDSTIFVTKKMGLFGTPTTIIKVSAGIDQKDVC